MKCAILIYIILRIFVFNYTQANILETIGAEENENFYTSYVRDVLYIDLKHYMSDQEKNYLATIQLSFDSEKFYTPFYFGAESRSRTILVPLSTLALIDEFSLTQAWLWSRGQSDVNLIEFMNRVTWTGNYEQRMRDVFMRPLKIWETDKQVKMRSSKTFKSTLAFFLMHEFYHIFLGHQSSVSDPYSREQELEADALAAEFLTRMPIIPLGVVQAFRSLLYFDLKQQLAKDQCESVRRTHPYLSERIKFLSDHLSDNTASYLEPKNQSEHGFQTVKKLAHQLNSLVRQFSQPELRESLIQTLPTLSPTNLQRLCR